MTWIAYYKAASSNRDILVGISNIGSTLQIGGYYVDTIQQIPLI